MHTPLLPASIKYHNALQKAYRLKKSLGSEFQAFCDTIQKTFPEIVTDFLKPKKSTQSIEQLDNEIINILGPYLSRSYKKYCLLINEKENYDASYSKLQFFDEED